MYSRLFLILISPWQQKFKKIHYAESLLSNVIVRLEDFRPQNFAVITKIT